MKITITTTQNGWLVTKGPVHSQLDPTELIPRSWSFNSLDAAIACLRKLMKPALQTDVQEVKK